MMKLALWIVGGAMAVAVLAPRASHPVAAAAAATDSLGESISVPAPEMAGNGLSDVTLMRAPDGHFYADALINGATIHVLVDTGASTVALTRADAQSAGVQFSNGEFIGRAQTAGGAVPLKEVTLDRVALGPIEAHNVEAVVVDADLNISLLGQSWLRRVGKVDIEGDKMVLR